MSDDCDCEEPIHSAEVQAGELYVFASGETNEEAAEAVMDLWNKVVGDLNEMPKEEREQVGLR